MRNGFAACGMRPENGVTKHMSQVYQRGSIRRLKRATGKDAWEWRYRVNGKMKQQTFPVSTFPTERKLWAHLEASVALLNTGMDQPLPVAVSMGTVIDRYRKEYIPELSSRSARTTYNSALTLHIEPRWALIAIVDVKPMDIDKWLKELKLSPASKGRLRRILKQLIDRAAYWELIPDSRPNPVRLVKVKGASKRQKRIVLLTPEQVIALIYRLNEPASIMVLIASCLGLRVEEIGALQWDDFDFQDSTVHVQRAWTHGEVKEVKTSTSETKMPLPEALTEALLAYRVRELRKPSKWLFPSSRKSDDKPRWTSMVFQDYIAPVAAELGYPVIGWHTFRHSFRSWIGGGAATVSQQKDLMRHASITTTLDVYGGTPVHEMRPHIDAVASKLMAGRSRTSSS